MVELMGLLWGLRLVSGTMLWELCGKADFQPTYERSQMYKDAFEQLHDMVGICVKPYDVGETLHDSGVTERTLYRALVQHPHFHLVCMLVPDLVLS